MPTTRSRSLAAVLALALAACGGTDDAGVEDDAALVEEPALETASDTTMAPAPAPADGAMLDPNTATAEQLRAVPVLSEEAVAALMSGRPYEDMLAVDAVLADAGLDEAQREEVYAGLWTPIDLNTASGEEILLIPGVGERMRHEFEEYRPYRAMAQFRREIGKYVPDEEVARLERYVTIEGS